ncbi:MAG: hypothetical protein HFF69_12325 [Oscillospiraceae bacterium]|nr:hypothetical protein [Oscillospiraceae bacterium]
MGQKAPTPPKAHINCFKLRDLGQALDFYVGRNAAAGVTISGSAGYQA